MTTFESIDQSTELGRALHGAHVRAFDHLFRISAYLTRERVRAGDDIDALDWGNLGDVGHVAEKLGEIVQTIESDGPIVARTGLWLPTAAVLCGECHNQWDARRGDAPTELRGSMQGEDVAKCDKCGAAVWVDAKVAHEQRAAVEITARLAKNDRIADLDLPADANGAKSTASMWQTGGMCSAAGVQVGEFGSVLVTEDEEEDDWTFYVGGYCYDDEGNELMLEGADVVESVTVDPNKPEDWDHLASEVAYRVLIIERQGRELSGRQS